MRLLESLNNRRTGNNPINIQYNLDYFRGVGSNYPDNGNYLDPNSEYRKRFIDMSQWISTEMKECGNLIDVAGGLGHLGYWMEKICPEIKVIYSDFSYEALLYGQKNYNYDSIRLSCSNLPYRSDLAKGILFADVLEHLEPEQAISSLLEAKRVLTDNGHLFINIPNRETWTRKTFDEPSHLWIPTLRDMKQGLNEIGFRNVSTFTRGFPWSSGLRNMSGKDMHLPIGGTSIFVHAIK